MVARRTEPVNLDLVRRHDETIVLVSDDEMREAAGPLWDEFGIAADLSGAALAALLTDRFRPRAGEQVCALVSGAGADGLIRRF
jgi:threonine dehydratase